MTTESADAPSCADPNEPEALSVDAAHARIAAALQPLHSSERVGLRAALNRVLAADVHAGHDIPPATNSAMDGYALRGTDLDADGAA
ncbi:MAG: molybdopterin molybdenumtransferase MoeA, partial [Halofilum sp. (in: g-proteobacteria)]|nr:molybdopterin molybdenumtransferase MoeA [Halofilum sp. (in: g-proteobacteria)]